MNFEKCKIMITKETIKSVIEEVPEERLEELYQVVKTFAPVELTDQVERQRKIEKASSSVFERRKDAYEELAKGTE